MAAGTAMEVVAWLVAATAREAMVRVVVLGTSSASPTTVFVEKRKLTVDDPAAAPP